MASQLSYLAIAIPPVIALWGLLALLRKKVELKAIGLAAVALVLMTVVFDNLIISFGIVSYDESLISGIKLWVAPIEDFSYTLAGLALIPLTWELLGRKK
ncbi:MAG: hypothetical protein RL068_439 [Actinomycetota bacterium]|jgi:lycopene cyclase domain-containing protein